MRIRYWSSDVCSSDLAAFDVAAVDYLLKPVSPERLARALARVREWRAADHGNQRKSQWITEFWVQNRGEMLRIDAGQVDLIEARSEERRVGTEWVRKCRTRWSPYH